MQQTLKLEGLPPVVKPLTGKGSGKERGRYKPRKIKPKTFSMYQELVNIQFQLALLINPLAVMYKPNNELIEYEYFNFWTLKYTNDKYSYKGEEYEGENFSIIGAELKGCEKLGIKENLFLHHQLFKQLTKIHLIRAAQNLQPLILAFANGDLIFDDKKPRYEYGDKIKRYNDTYFCLGQTRYKQFVFKRMTDGKEIVLNNECDTLE